MDYDNLPQPTYDGLIDPNELHTDGENPNSQSADMFGLLCENMKKKGWLGAPILTDTAGLIADGEHRWRAAKEIGLTEVPVKQFDIDDAERRLWRQELNKISGYHDQFRDALEYDFLIQNGKADDVHQLTEAANEELDELLDMIKDRPSEFPDYKYDEHHEVYFEDCVGGMRDKVEDESVDCLVTDPPYGMAFHEDSDSENHETGDRVKAWDTIEGDQSIDEMMKLMRSSMEEIARVLKEDGHAYIFCDWRGISDIYPLVENYLNIKNVLVWDKGSMGIGDLTHNWGYSHEFLIFATKGDRAHELNKAHRNVLEYGRIPRVDYEHPTQKPVELISQLVENSTEMGDLVLDPFVGSGTTAVACIQGARNFVGFELDSDNFKRVVDRRIQEAKRARLAGVNSDSETGNE